jgi:hypothetical protein
MRLEQPIRPPPHFPLTPMQHRLIIKLQLLVGLTEEGTVDCNAGNVVCTRLGNLQAICSTAQPLTVAEAVAPEAVALRVSTTGYSCIG